MLNYSTKSVNKFFKNVLCESKYRDNQTKFITNIFSKPFLTYENLKKLDSKIDFFTKRNKKQFSEKSSTEDLIEQILQSKANNAKKTFVGQENGNLNSNRVYAKNNYNNNENGRSNYYNKNSFVNDNNVNDNGNYYQNDYNQFSRGNENQGNINYQIRGREDNYSNGNSSYNSNSYRNNQNYNSGMNNSNQNNLNNGNNNNGNYYNSNNNSNQGNYNNNTYRKRNRISIIRDGMNINLNLRRPGMHSVKPDSYVVLEVKEFKMNKIGEIDTTDPRFVILSGSNLCKLILLDPKTNVKNDSQLQKIVINQKNKVFSIEQNEDNVYTASIKVYKQENTDNDNLKTDKEGDSHKEENFSSVENTRISNQILVQSQIDLNPEDVMVIKIFAQASMMELLNF